MPYLDCGDCPDVSICLDVGACQNYPKPTTGEQRPASQEEARGAPSTPAECLPDSRDPANQASGRNAAAGSPNLIEGKLRAIRSYLPMITDPRDRNAIEAILDVTDEGPAADGGAF